MTIFAVSGAAEAPPSLEPEQALSVSAVTATAAMATAPRTVWVIRDMQISCDRYAVCGFGVRDGLREAAGQQCPHSARLTIRTDSAGR